MNEELIIITTIVIMLLIIMLLMYILGELMEVETLKYTYIDYNTFAISKSEDEVSSHYELFEEKLKLTLGENK